MRHIQVNEVDDLGMHADEVYELGQQAPTQKFDSAVDRLIRCLDKLCRVLEEHGRQSARRRETVAVEGLHRALEKVRAAIISIDSVRRYYEWEYHGTRRDEHEWTQDDNSVVGLVTLKRRFNALMVQERHEKVRSIVRETLAEHFADEFVFEPILIVPTVDEFGDGDGSTYLRILIVFDGDQEKLDPGWTSGLIGRIEPKLIEAGITEFPSPSFIKKSEWWRSYPKWQRHHPGEIQMVEFPRRAVTHQSGSG